VVSSRREEGTFRGYNRSRPYAERLRPFNFLTMYHVARIIRSSSGPRCLVAPFERDANRWLDAECFDRQDRKGTTHRVRTSDPYLVLPHSILVESLYDYFEDYLLFGQFGVTMSLSPPGALAFSRYTRLADREPEVESGADGRSTSVL
jgi:hypothetical protein